MSDGRDPSRWYTTNLVGVPAPVLASTAFNAHPQRLRIAGARECSAGLFALLERSADAAHARELFAHYMDLAFGLGDATRERGTHRRASYMKLLQGWGLDANGAAGAVLKGWVESRFGLVPGFHKAALANFPSPAWLAYIEEKASARWCNNNIHHQLDLLFEFCQWMLERFRPFGAESRHITLWRGSTRVEEQVVAGSLRARRCVVRLNNVVSFSASPEQAGCFGDWVLCAQVPLAKLLYMPGLVDTRALDGEGEFIALGGDYDVQASYAC